MHIRPIHVLESRGVTPPPPSETTAVPSGRVAGHTLDLGIPSDNQALASLTIGGQRRWDKRELLYRGDDPAEVFYRITKGIVAEFTVLSDGRRQIVALRTVGNLCGYPTRNGLHAFTAQAVTAVEACALGAERFRSRLGHNVEFACAVANDVSERLKQTLANLTVVGQLRSVERVAHFIVEMEELHRVGGTEAHAIALHLSRQEIADYLGLTLETVSRAFGKLKDMRLIALAGADVVNVLDPQKLLQVAKLTPHN